MLLQDQIAVVTGSSRGIGAATARLLASHGAQVVVNYAQQQAQGQAVVDAIVDAGGRAILVQADVRDETQVRALFEQTEQQLGSVDILVNNANMSFPIKSFLDYNWAEFASKLNNELHAAFTCCQIAAKSMVQRGQGCIVNVSSGLSRQAGPGFVAHSSAKSALDAFTRALALELGPQGVRVNTVAPGLTLTDATAQQPAQMHEAIRQRTPLRRLAEPDDIAGAILFCCSPWSKFVTGTYLPVSGGSLML